MVLTDAAGHALTESDIAFLDAHPRIARLAVKRCRADADPSLTDGQRREVVLAWARAILPAARKHSPWNNSPPERTTMPKNVALNLALNDTTDTPERRKLLALLSGTLNAMPENSDPAQLPQIAAVLIGEALSSAARQGFLPMAARFAALASCREALLSLPISPSLADFRRDAKTALQTADLGL